MKRNNTNEAEFRVMYKQYFDPVARYCLRRLPEHSAQDAVSDVFLTAWRRFDSIPPGDQSLPWLYGIAKNVVRNINRSGRRSMRLSAKVKAQAHYPEPSPDVQVIRKEQDDELVAALLTLKADDQEVLRLRAYEGLSVKQISIAIGCSEEAAKKRVSRALCRLRKAAAIEVPVPSGVNPRATQQGGER
ncbi:MAG: sigma-70 family RNA polymerase sigma factor [Actinomycetia bacterium]|nr:sigma-70 family RNA polymerase sigma factor [Actinomycetes bacterium]